MKTRKQKGCHIGAHSYSLNCSYDCKDRQFFLFLKINNKQNNKQNENDIKEQTIQKSDKPKNLKDLLSSMDSKPKPKKAKPQQKEKPKNNEEPKKMTFYNSKGTANANEIDKEAKKFTEKKVFKNSKGLGAVSKENEKIKPTKNYTEKDVEKAYNEDVAKPKFFTSKESEENFVELNKNEDVRDNIYLIPNIFL